MHLKPSRFRDRAVKGQSRYSDHSDVSAQKLGSSHPGVPASKENLPCFHRSNFSIHNSNTFCPNVFKKASFLPAQQITKRQTICTKPGVLRTLDKASLSLFILGLALDPSHTQLACFVHSKHVPQYRLEFVLLPLNSAKSPFNRQSPVCCCGLLWKGLLDFMFLPFFLSSGSDLRLDELRFLVPKDQLIIFKNNTDCISDFQRQLLRKFLI